MAAGTLIGAWRGNLSANIVRAALTAAGVIVFLNLREFVRRISLADLRVGLIMLVDSREIEIELPTLLVEETDFFITMPVPKVHAMTGVSLGFKNQWGCIPDVKRLRHHPDFVRKVIEINKILNTRLVVFDGTYFLNRSGPMSGEERI